MTIKEVEQLLGLPRATIRFYEKEELLTPRRGGNAYREYSEDDIAVLKKIIIFRKLGFSVAEIKDFLEENVPLQDLLEKNILELQEKMKELDGAMRICKKMQSRQEDFDSFNEAYYWEEIRKQEQVGNKFLEIVNDSVKFEKKLILDYFAIGDSKGDLIKDRKEVVFKIAGAFAVYGLTRFVLVGLNGEWSIDNFWRGLIDPFVFVLIYSIWELPLYFLGKKSPKAVKVIRKIGDGIFLILMLMLLFLLIFGEETV